MEWRALQIRSVGLNRGTISYVDSIDLAPGGNDLVSTQRRPLALAEPVELW